MAVRIRGIRPVAGSHSIAKTTLVALAVAGLLPDARRSAAAPGGREGGEPRSVLVHPAGTSAVRVPANNANAVRMPANARVISDRRVGEPVGLPDGQGVQSEPIGPGTILGDGLESSGPVVGGGAPLQGGTYDQYQGLAPGSIVDDGSAGVPGQAWDGAASQDGGYDQGAYDQGAYGQGGYDQGGYGDGGYALGGGAPCGTPGCNGACNTCQNRQLDPAWRYNANCEPSGLFQRLWGLCRAHDDAGTWTGRVDALILSRNAPAFRPLYTVGPGGPVALNADQLESIAAVGPRVSLFKRDHCNTSWEGTYIYSGGFVAEQNRANQTAIYDLAEPGIYGVLPGVDVNAVQSRLTSSLQSAELNRRWNWGPATQFLAGFRWLQWQESLSITDYYDSGVGQDFFNTNTYNNLYGGQIGLDTLLWQPWRRFRIEGLVKAGAYYNSASQSSQYMNVNSGIPSDAAMVNVGRSPATCSFAGELGLTGVVPLHPCIDFRFGYFGLWLASIAQPVGQLNGQSLVQGYPIVGSVSTSGNVVLQGLSLGLEGRW
jgi:hypothetical protein